MHRDGLAHRCHHFLVDLDRLHDSLRNLSFLLLPGSLDLLPGAKLHSHLCVAEAHFADALDGGGRASAGVAALGLGEGCQAGNSEDLVN